VTCPAAGPIWPTCSVARRVWTAADLDAWIAVHAGMDDETERADLIAYLEKATAR
jgi:cytochrome c2